MKKSEEIAQVNFLPYSTGDGYGWGGGVILTIMGKAIPFGEGKEAEKLAKEIARRWNAGIKETTGLIVLGIDRDSKTSEVNGLRVFDPIANITANYFRQGHSND